MLTGKAKEDFEKGIIDILITKYNEKITDEKRAIDWIYDANDLILFAHIMEWFDSVGLHIMIEPYLGGGQVVFYFKVIYRDEWYIDTWYSSVDDDVCLSTRQEAAKDAIEKANEIYNKQ